MPARSRISCRFPGIVAATFAAGVFAVVSPATAQDHWPQWRGPNQNGVADNTGLPTTWDVDRNIVWKTKLPSWSGGTPIVWGEYIFLTSPSEVTPEQAEREAREREAQQQQQQRRRGRRGSGRSAGGDELMLLCLARDTGKILWSRTVDTGNEVKYKQNNTSPSPVTDGRHVWVVTGTGAVACFDFAGKEIWKKKLQEMYGSFGLNWGYASSPLLHDGKLIVEVLHGTRTDDPSYIVAFDATSGDVVWRVERPTDAPAEAPDAYTTPIVIDNNGRTEIVITGGDYITGHDPETGRELWRTGGLNPRKARNYRIVASPLFVDGIIYAPTRVRPLLAIRPGGGDGDSADPVVWKWDRPGAPDVPTPACDGERFFMVNDAGMVTCLDAKTGEVIWGPERTVPGTVSSSPLLADGKLYFTNEEGVTVVVSAGDTFELLASNELDGSFTLSSPVPAGEHLLVRTGTHLYCIGEAGS